MRSSRRMLPVLTAAALLAGTALQAQSPTLLRLRNPESLDRVVVDSAGGLVVSGTFDVGSIPASNAGVRMMWYPGKGAFRAGRVTGGQWDDAFVGYYSSALGYNAMASGFLSTAMGNAPTASGIASIAIGSSSRASGNYSTAVGYSVTASGAYSLAVGYNTRADGTYSSALGRSTTASGNVSTAMGYFASTNGFSGAFVYGDASTTSTVSATASNQFSVRAAGGVRFFTNSGLTSGVTLAAGGSSWSVVSDRARKEHFLSVDGEDVLARIRALPISTWRYTAEADRATRHIGPMAQDWHAAFGFSADSLTINSGDFDGVNLAGVQALERRTAEQAERIRLLEDENARQAALIAMLATRLERLEQEQRR